MSFAPMAVAVGNTKTGCLEMVSPCPITRLSWLFANSYSASPRWTSEATKSICPDELIEPPTSVPDLKTPPSGAVCPTDATLVMWPFAYTKTPVLVVAPSVSAEKAICPALFTEVVKAMSNALPSGSAVNSGTNSVRFPFTKEKVPVSAEELETPEKITCPRSLKEGGSKKPKGTPSGITSLLAIILVTVPDDHRNMPCRPSDNTAVNKTCRELLGAAPSRKLTLPPPGNASPGPITRVRVLLE